MLYLNIFLWIAASVADAAAVNPDSIKTLLTNGLSTFFIKGNALFGNGAKLLSKKHPDCPVWCNWVFDNFVLAEDYLHKLYQGLKLVYLLMRKLCRELFSSLELLTIFDGSFKVTSIAFFILDFILLSCELGSLRFKVLLYWVFLY